MTSRMWTTIVTDFAAAYRYAIERELGHGGMATDSYRDEMAQAGR